MRLCVPSVDSWNDPVRGEEPDCPTTVTGAALSVQLKFVTPFTSSAETLTVTGTLAALKKPAWPPGTDGTETVTVGGVLSACTLRQRSKFPPPLVVVRL